MVVTIHFFVAISLPVLKDMTVMAMCLHCSELLGVYFLFFFPSSLEQLQKLKHSKMFSLLAPKQKLIARIYKWQKKKTQTPVLCLLQETLRGVLVMQSFPVRYMWILIKLDSSLLLRFAGKLYKNIGWKCTKSWLWAQHTWKYINALLCKWT